MIILATKLHRVGIEPEPQAAGECKMLDQHKDYIGSMFCFFLVPLCQHFTFDWAVSVERLCRRTYISCVSLNGGYHHIISTCLDAWHVTF